MKQKKPKVEAEGTNEIVLISKQTTKFKNLFLKLGIFGIGHCCIDI